MLVRGFILHVVVLLAVFCPYIFLFKIYVMPKVIRGSTCAHIRAAHCFVECTAVQDLAVVHRGIDTFLNERLSSCIEAVILDIPQKVK